MTYTIEILQELCAELGLYSKPYGDNAALIVPLTRAEEPERPIYNVFLLDSDRLSAYAVSTGFDLPQERLFDAHWLCNRWNRDRFNTRAYVDKEGELRLDLNFIADDLPREFVRERFIRDFIAASGDFFEQAAALFPLSTRAGAANE